MGIAILAIAAMVVLAFLLKKEKKAAAKGIEEVKAAGTVHEAEVLNNGKEEE